MKKTKSIIALILCMLTLFSTMSISVSAASVSSSLGYNKPETSGDWVQYKNGKMVKSSSMSKDEVKFVQNAINYLIDNRGLTGVSKLSVDGDFGKLSSAAILAFQKAVNKSIANKKLSISKLAEDSSCGSQTIKALIYVLDNGNKTTLDQRSIPQTTTYSVNFDPNGGSVSISKVTVSKGSYTILPTATKSSVKITFNANGGKGEPTTTTGTYVCIGWSTNKNATTAQYSCRSKFTPTKNITLYAVWKPVTLSKIIPTNGNKTFLGWSTNKNATSATYKAGQNINLTGNITLYAVWQNFVKKNILQWDYTNKYYNGSNINRSGCGIVSAVSSVYNCTGKFIQPNTVADWAYKAGYYNNPKYNSCGGGINNREAYMNAFVNKYGATYGFKSSGSGSNINTDTVKNHLAKGGTAVVHVNGHYMCLAGYDKSTDRFLVYDPSPGKDRNGYNNSSRRSGLTSVGGDWISTSKLTSGTLNSNMIRVDWYYLITKK